ncbi:MAG: hypothetical protein IPM63_17445 [Acidobacteriota bacterium]|nr:MAG: hypothetical protein IPM63_17445 [Acidobacteriota bacterium]
MPTQGSTTVSTAETGKSRVMWSSDNGAPALDSEDLELGHWLAGLRSFVGDDSALFSSAEGVARHPAKEARLVQSVLLSLSARAMRLEAKSRSADPGVGLRPTGGRRSGTGSYRDLAELLRELVLIGERQASTGASDGALWSASRRHIHKSLAGSQAVGGFIRASEAAASEILPERILGLRDSKDIPERWSYDLGIVLPKIGTITSYLRVVASLLEKDEPLRQSIFLFSRIDDLIRDLMAYINNRLLRFPDDTDALFGSLDGAAYTASIELRKVHANELRGLFEIRPTPLVFARIETAYSLLNDSLQMTLVNFAQLIDRDIEPTDVFPDLLTKEQQSIQLRENMWHLLQIVQKTEQDPDSCPPEELKKELVSFRDRNLYYLFYKDMETVERFIEEVVITADNKDLVPLLHRFGAYLETLLGQVNMRVVLAKHPFGPLQRDAHDFSGSM